MGKSLEALVLILHFQASGLKNALKTRDSSWKMCLISLPVQLGLTACALSIWKSSAELHLFVFVPGEARSCFKWVISWWLSVLYVTHLVFLQLWQSGRWTWEDFTALFPSCFRGWGRGQLFEFLTFPIWRHLCPRDICKLNMLKYQLLSFCLGVLTVLFPPPSSFDWILVFTLLFFPLNDCKHSVSSRTRIWGMYTRAKRCFPWAVAG